MQAQCPACDTKQDMLDVVYDSLRRIEDWFVTAGVISPCPTEVNVVDFAQHISSHLCSPEAVDAKVFKIMGLFHKTETLKQHHVTLESTEPKETVTQRARPVSVDSAFRRPAVPRLQLGSKRPLSADRALTDVRPSPSSPPSCTPPVAPPHMTAGVAARTRPSQPPDADCSVDAPSRTPPAPAPQRSSVRSDTQLPSASRGSQGSGCAPLPRAPEDDSEYAAQRYGSERARARLRSAEVAAASRLAGGAGQSGMGQGSTSYHGASGARTSVPPPVVTDRQAVEARSGSVSRSSGTEKQGQDPNAKRHASVDSGAVLSRATLERHRHEGVSGAVPSRASASTQERSRNASADTGALPSRSSATQERTRHEGVSVSGRSSPMIPDITRHEGFDSGAVPSRASASTQERHRNASADTGAVPSRSSATQERTRHEGVSVSGRSSPMIPERTRHEGFDSGAAPSRASAPTQERHRNASADTGAFPSRSSATQERTRHEGVSISGRASPMIQERTRYDGVDSGAVPSRASASTQERSRNASADIAAVSTRHPATQEKNRHPADSGAVPSRSSGSNQERNRQYGVESGVRISTQERYRHVSVDSAAQPRGSAPQERTRHSSVDAAATPTRGAPQERQRADTPTAATAMQRPLRGPFADIARENGNVESVAQNSQDSMTRTPRFADRASPVAPEPRVENSPTTPLFGNTACAYSGTVDPLLVPSPSRGKSSHARYSSCDPQRPKEHQVRHQSVDAKPSRSDDHVDQSLQSDMNQSFIRPDRNEYTFQGAHGSYQETDQSFQNEYEYTFQGAPHGSYHTEAEQSIQIEAALQGGKHRSFQTDTDHAFQKEYSHQGPSHGSHHAETDQSFQNEYGHTFQGAHGSYHTETDQSIQIEAALQGGKHRSFQTDTDHSFQKEYSHQGPSHRSNQTDTDQSFQQEQEPFRRQGDLRHSSELAHPHPAKMLYQGDTPHRFQHEQHPFQGARHPRQEPKKQKPVAVNRAAISLDPSRTMRLSTDEQSRSSNMADDPSRPFSSYEAHLRSNFDPSRPFNGFDPRIPNGGRASPPLTQSSFASSGRPCSPALTVSERDAKGKVKGTPLERWTQVHGGRLSPALSETSSSFARPSSPAVTEPPNQHRRVTVPTRSGHRAYPVKKRTALNGARCKYIPNRSTSSTKVPGEAGTLTRQGPRDYIPPKGFLTRQGPADYKKMATMARARPSTPLRRTTSDNTAMLAAQPTVLQQQQGYSLTKPVCAPLSVQTSNIHNSTPPSKSSAPRHQPQMHLDVRTEWLVESPVHNDGGKSPVSLRNAHGADNSGVNTSSELGQMPCVPENMRSAVKAQRGPPDVSGSSRSRTQK